MLSSKLLDQSTLPQEIEIAHNLTQVSPKHLRKMTMNFKKEDHMKSVEESSLSGSSHH